MRRTEAYGVAAIFVLCWTVVTAPFRMVGWILSSISLRGIAILAAVFLIVALLA